MSSTNQRTAPAAAAPAFLPPEAEAVIEKPAERTSLADRHYASDEVTVRFLRWHALGTTANKPGLCAGFTG